MEWFIEWLNTGISWIFLSIVAIVVQSHVKET